MPIDALRGQGNGHGGFDYYVRSVTTSLLALAIVGATLYKILTSAKPNELLIGWTGIVIGVYFGYHAAKNGGSDAPYHPEQTPPVQIPQGNEH